MDDPWVDLARDRRISIGFNVVQLASEPENWIQRRVETLEVSSRRLVRRSVGVDLVSVPPAILFWVAFRAAPRQVLRIDPAAASKLRRANGRIATVERAFDERQASGAQARSAA